MEWIKCSERLPQYNIHVLATDGKMQWVAVRWTDGLNEYFNSYICTCCNFDEGDFKAKYWMPLPEPPKE